MLQNVLVLVILILLIQGSEQNKVESDCEKEPREDIWSQNSQNMESYHENSFGKVALVLGASGETGKEVVKNLVENKDFREIIVVGRRELTFSDDEKFKKITQKIVNFDNLSAHKEVFTGIDVAFCCLGTTRAIAGAEGFVKVDHDYVLEAATLLNEFQCPEFHLLTSKGSNSGSMFLYPSTKGKVEEAVIDLKFNKLSIYRPGLLLCSRDNRRFLEEIFQKISRWIDRSHWWSVSTSMVGKVMVDNSIRNINVSNKDDVEILEHDDIIKYASNL